MRATVASGSLAQLSNSSSIWCSDCGGSCQSRSRWPSASAVCDASQQAATSSRSHARRITRSPAIHAIRASPLVLPPSSASGRSSPAPPPSKYRSRRQHPACSAATAGATARAAGTAARVPAPSASTSRSSSVPSTLTYASACRRSGETSTCVTVTMPLMRGSLQLAADQESLSSSRRSSFTCSVRRDMWLKRRRPVRTGRRRACFFRC